MIRTFYTQLLFLIGMISLIVGIVAILIPLLPTTPFLLVSAYCFSKSSPRFRHWLTVNKFFGPQIIEWETHQIIRPKQKAMAVASLCLSLSIPLFFLTLPLWGRMSAALTGVLVIIFILTRKSRI